VGESSKFIENTELAKRQSIHPLFYRGTIGNINFYVVRGEQFARIKSSLSGKRVRSAKEFTKTMYHASLLGRASKIGSAVYNALPQDWRQFWMYRAFTGEAMKMMKEGMKEEEITAKLIEVYVPKKRAQIVKTPARKKRATRGILANNKVPYIVCSSDKVAKVGLYSTLQTSVSVKARAAPVKIESHGANQSKESNNAGSRYAIRFRAGAYSNRTAI
jgi:hypothetical protein